MFGFTSHKDEEKEIVLSRKQSHLTGQKPPLKLREIWAIRTRLQLAGNTRELALFNLAIDSKLRSCDLLRLKVEDIASGIKVLSRVTMIQKKTGQPVKFEITKPTQESLKNWIDEKGLRANDFLFPSRLHHSPHLSRRQYSRIVKSWVATIGFDPAEYGTHSMRRTKPTLIYSAPRIFGRSSSC